MTKELSAQNAVITQIQPAKIVRGKDVVMETDAIPIRLRHGFKLDRVDFTVSPIEDQPL